MLWIIGLGALVSKSADVVDWKPLQWLAKQMNHSSWYGFTLLDLIFPLFLFIAGVAVPFALEKRRAQGHSRAKLFWRVTWRGLMLVVLGVVLNGLLRGFDFAHVRYSSVLGLIGFGYLFAALIYLYTTVRGQALWMMGLLIGYWALLKFVAPPGGVAGDWAAERNFADYIDKLLLARNHDPEGPLRIITATADALLGILAGQWLRLSIRSGNHKALALGVAGAICFGLGWLWHPWFPVIKHLWTSSYILVAGGLSLMLLALFYWIIDVRQHRRWAWPLIVVGMNSITIYVLVHVVDFTPVSHFFFGGFAELSGDWGPAVIPAGELILAWLVLWFLYRKKTFLKV